MKKLILSALFVSAFSMGLFAKGSIEVPFMAKFALQEATTTEVVTLLAEQVTCINTSIPICDGEEAVNYISVRICADDPYAMAASFDCGN